MQFVGFPTLIAGIVLMTAGTHWFSGASTVGLILTIVSTVAIVLGWIIVLVIANAARNIHRSTRRRW